MPSLVRILSFGLLVTVGSGGLAQAQYYAPPPGPPPGYYPAPPPPRPYYRPPGYRCDATFRPPYGPRQHLICDLANPKPLGVGCVCPPPPPPPGYSYGPYLRGRTIE